MEPTEDNDHAKIVKLRGSKLPGGLPDAALAADGLLLMRAFNKIGSQEDRQKVIALAQRLSSES